MQGSNSTFHAVASALRASSPPPAGFAPLSLVGPESPMMEDNKDYFVPLATKLINEVRQKRTFSLSIFLARHDDFYPDRLGTNVT